MMENLRLVIHPPLWSNLVKHLETTKESTVPGAEILLIKGKAFHLRMTHMLFHSLIRKVGNKISLLMVPWLPTEQNTGLEVRNSKFYFCVCYHRLGSLGQEPNPEMRPNWSFCCWVYCLSNVQPDLQLPSQLSCFRWVALWFMTNSTNFICLSFLIWNWYQCSLHHKYLEITTPEAV